MCEVSDSKSMSKSIVAALVLTQEENSDEKRSAVSASRRYIKQHFTLDLMCQDTLALYDRVISDKAIS